MKRMIIFATMLMSCVAMWAGNQHLYRGNSHYSSDILYTFTGVIPVPVLIYMM